ncbi:MAG: AMP-binding protein, partial [Waterburya sp.]
MFHPNNFPSLTAEEKIHYWQKQLANIAPLIDFQTDHSRSTISDSVVSNNHQNNMGQEMVVLSEDLSQALNEVAQAENIDLEVLLLGAFQVLLYRYTNQEDIIVGCLDWFDTKDETRLEILPVTLAIQNQQPFSWLLAAIQVKIAEASNYGDLSVEKLHTVLVQQNANFSRASLSQMLFRFKSTASNSEVKLTKKTKTFGQELFLDVVEQGANLICRIEYDRNLFVATTIKRIAENYQVLLKSIASNPQAKIASLSLLSEVERQQVLEQGNQTETEFDTSCIHHLFEAQAKQNPQALALICQGEQLTYGELNAQANQLAHYLQSRGVTSESLVGLCVERSLLMVVGLLAILKAGGAYIPLDISNPPARLGFILEDAQVKILVTQSSLQDKLSGQIEQTICLDRDWHLIAEQPETNLEQNIVSSDLAHIVYTSGSTGKPKGVMLTHGNLSHYAQSLQAAWKITPSDTYLHRGSIALIVSARQLLMPLAQGATALIITAQEGKDPLKLFELIKHHQVTIVDHVPSFWRNFSGIIEQQNSDRRNSLLDNQVRLVAAGGEQVTPEIYQCWRKIFKPEVKLANIYGQTEGTGVVTIYPIPESIDCGFKSLSVGYPIPNMKVYLLDQHLQPVPMGVAAEIHISG